MSRNKTGTKRKTVSGRTVISRVGKPSHARSGITGEKLQGVPKRSPVGMSKLSKTQKRPERKFGGVLSGRILATLLKEKARLQSGVIGEEDVPLTHLQYIKKMK